MSGWDTLVRAEELAAALGNEKIAIVDCRFSLADPQAGARAYAQAHVPGARVTIQMLPLGTEAHAGDAPAPPRADAPR